MQPSLSELHITIVVVTLNVIAISTWSICYQQLAIKAPRTRIRAVTVACVIYRHTRVRAVMITVVRVQSYI